MINWFVFLCLCFIPFQASAMSVRVNIDVNIIKGDGTINDGEKNESHDERENSGSHNEDSSTTYE